jgi:hypothetical protein
MRQPVRTVNRDKAHLPPARDPFRSRDAENYRVQDGNTASLWVVSNALVARWKTITFLAALRHDHVAAAVADRRGHQRWPFPALRREGTLGNPATRRRHHLLVRRPIRSAGACLISAAVIGGFELHSRRSSLPPGTTGSGRTCAQDAPMQSHVARSVLRRRAGRSGIGLLGDPREHHGLPLNRSPQPPPRAAAGSPADRVPSARPPRRSHRAHFSPKAILP